MQQLTKHGHNRRGKTTETYISWHGMIQRCANPTHKSYRRYGGSGITVCERWLKFPNFLKDMGERPNEKSIDRINNKLGYCKENCQWSTRKEQQRNRRNNLYIIYNGEKRLLIEWAEETGIQYKTLCRRIFKHKWTVEKALTTPVRRMRKAGN